MNIASALLQLRPGAQWSVPNGCTDASQIIWHDNTKPVSQAELDAEMAKPEPVPPPLTPAQKLAAAGLSVDELKQLLGLTPQEDLTDPAPQAGG